VLQSLNHHRELGINVVAISSDDKINDNHSPEFAALSKYSIPNNDRPKEVFEQIKREAVQIVIVADSDKFDNEFIRDLCCIMGLDPVKELANIAIEEINKELLEISIKKGN
jgi:hypothetical protein